MMYGKITRSGGKVTVDESQRRQAGPAFRARLKKVADAKQAAPATEEDRQTDQSPRVPAHA
jgi:hypothetical protein